MGAAVCRRVSRSVCTAPLGTDAQGRGCDALPVSPATPGPSTSPASASPQHRERHCPVARLRTFRKSWSVLPLRSRAARPAHSSTITDCGLTRRIMSRTWHSAGRSMAWAVSEGFGAPPGAASWTARALRGAPQRACRIFMHSVHGVPSDC